MGLLSRIRECLSGACAERRAGRVLVGLLLAGYLLFVFSRMGLCAGGSDSSGYVNGARILRDGRLGTEQRQLEGTTGVLPGYTYVPLGFVPMGTAPGAVPQMSPTYPLGLPALIVAASAGGSLDVGMYVAMLLMLTGSLVLTYRMCRLVGLAPVWALAGAGMLAWCPLFLGMAFDTMSDIPALFWTTLVLVLALESGERRWMAALAGVAVAIGVFVRPSNVLVVLPVAWALGRDWRRWLWLGLAGLPGAIVWALMNKVLFGRYVATGYGDVSQLFAWHNVLPVFHNYAATFPRILPLAVLVLLTGTARVRSPEGRAVAVAATWTVVLGVFYSFYFHTQEVWWYMRFVLPAFPALIALAVRGLRRVHGWIAGTGPTRRPVLAGAVVAVLLAAQLAEQIGSARRWWVFQWGAGERNYVELCRRLEAHAPRNAVVFAMQASGALFYYEPWIVVRRDYLAPEQSEMIYAAAAKAGRPVFAVMFPFELEDGSFGKNLAGRWTRIEAVGDKSLWRLDDPAGTMPAVVKP